MFDALRETFKYITWDRQYIAEELMIKLAKQYRILYANGNHETKIKEREYKFGKYYEEYRLKLEDAGIEFINNKKYTIEKNGEHIVFTGYESTLGYYKKATSQILPVEELEQAIVALSKGNTYFNNVASKVINSLLPSKNEKHNIKDEKSYLFDNYKSLSKKEKEIFIYLAKGLDIYEIVKLLGKSEKTILNQRTAIYHKMFVQDRHDLIEKAKLLGVIF